MLKKNMKFKIKLKKKKKLKRLKRLRLSHLTHIVIGPGNSRIFRTQKKKESSSWVLPYEAMAARTLHLYTYISHLCK